MRCDCSQCSKTYEVTQQDLEFYDRVSPVLNGRKFAVPPPTSCPTCRQQRRLAWRNEWNLYRRGCSLCAKNIISVHRADTLYPVYCIDCWWSDRWNPLDFGLELDHSKPFLQQIAELQKRVPQLAIQNDNNVGSVNSEYCYDISRAKNCNRVVGSWYIEDCQYGLNVNRSKFLIDCVVCCESELLYEVLDSQRCYNSAYLQNCEGCSDCFFGFDLKGCNDCLACFGLRHKRFHIFNTPYTEEQYRAKLKELNLGSHQGVKELRERFDTFILTKPRRAANLQNCEDAVGNNLFNCKEVLGYSSFNLEYSKFIDRSDGPKCCYDIINSGGPQWCLDCVTPDDSYNVLFSVWCWKSKNILYSDNCHSSADLCGCISLRRSGYCILNRQYSRSEFESHMVGIIESLQRDGDWGALFPIRLSPFAYNESAATEYYPLDKPTTLSRGWRWADALPDTKGKETVDLQQVPDNISEVDDTLVDQVLCCQACAKNYKINMQELSFYRRLPAPVPLLCPLCRHRARWRRRTPTEIWRRECAKCQTAIQTSYSPDSCEIVYCDSCYFAEIY